MPKIHTSLGFIKRKLIQVKAFLIFVTQNFLEDDCTYRASALTFTSLLAVVPLMSVGFAVLSTFPVFDELKDPIQNFIFENFVPSTGKALQSYLQLFTQQVSKLSIIGTVFLFVTALLVMYTIERAMNKIWRVKTSRHGVSAFLLYWAILSLAPVLLGLSLAASSYVFSLPFTQAYTTTPMLLRIVPSIISLTAFTFLYVVVPNCRVKIRYGFVGAIFATVLFETAKKGFAAYLSQYNSYELLYGAFAIIPIFFVWVYWVWIITLIGAEISYALSVHYQRRPGPTLDPFTQALLWLHALWQGQQKGQSVSIDTLTNACKAPYSVSTTEMLDTLSEIKLIKATANGHYILSRDLSHLSLYDLSYALPYRLPNSNELADIKTPFEDRWPEIIKTLDKQIKGVSNTSLDELFRGKN